MTVASLEAQLRVMDHRQVVEYRSCIANEAILSV